MYALAALALPLLASASPVAKAPVVARQVAGQCSGQSCEIADLSGSTGQAYTGTTQPADSTYSGDCCVIYYNPSIAPLAYSEVNGLEQYCAIFPYSPPSSKVKREEVAKRQFTTCAAKTLIYAKGTFEPGDLGVTVGPQLQTDLNSIAPGVWSIQGVDYDPSYDGDECLGLPGGVVATKLIEQVASQCPFTEIVLSGYSQGAMVVRNGLANSNAGSRVKVCLFFSSVAAMGLGS